MFCPSCGSLLDDDSSFCPQCGEQISPTEDVGAPQDVPSEGSVPSPAPRKPRGLLGKRLLAVVAVAAVLVVGAVAAVTLATSSPEKQIALCLKNSVDAFTQDQFGLKAVFSAAQKGKTRQEISLRPGDDFWEGLTGTMEYYGLSEDMFEESNFLYAVETDLSARQVAMELSAAFDGTALGSVQAFLDNNIVSLGSPELVDGDFYGVNSETLGHDLTMSAFDTGYFPDDMGFNFFDLLDQAKENQKGLPLSQETKDVLKTCNKSLLEACTFEKLGKAQADVNGRKVSCKQYAVTISAEDLWHYIAKVCEAVYVDEKFVAFMDAATATGSDSYRTWQEECVSFLYQLEDVLGELSGDVTLHCYTAQKKVMRLECEARLKDGSGYDIGGTLILQLGGAKEYIDEASADLLLYARDDKLKFSLSSQGNHKPVKGVYSDVTKLSASEDGSRIFALKCTTDYSSKAKEDNFSFDARLTPDYGSPMALAAQGTVLIDKGGKSFSADFSDLSLQVEEEKLSLAGGYSIRPIRALSFRPDAPIMVLEMDQDELSDLVDTIDMNAEAIAANIPGLLY